MNQPLDARMVLDWVLRILSRLNKGQSRFKQFTIIDIERLCAKHRVTAVFATCHPKDRNVLDNLGGESLLSCDAARSV